MSFFFDSDSCTHCSNHCLGERRHNGTGDQAKFLFKQQVALACTFDSFVPGSDRDPQPERQYFYYLQQFRTNILNAGRYLFGDDFDLNAGALAKLEDDVFEALEAAALWNAAATWNGYMQSGQWSSRSLLKPPDALPRPELMIAVVRLPRNYDATMLFDEATRFEIDAFEHSLNSRDMTLKLSCPDLVGIRLKPGSAGTELFLEQLDSFSADNLRRCENAYRALEGGVAGRDLLCAISIRKTVSGYRFYQSLFEANVLKFLAQEVLHNPWFRFIVHVGSSEGGPLEERYKVVSLHSLLKGGAPRCAVDRVHTSLSPLGGAQALLDDLPSFSPPP